MERKKAEDNLICPICGKSFHRKPSAIKKPNGRMLFVAPTNAIKKLGK